MPLHAKPLQHTNFACPKARETWGLPLCTKPETELFRTDFPLSPPPPPQYHPFHCSSWCHTFYCLDLCSAFFAVPLHVDSQFLFALSYSGHSFTWTRLPQGFAHRPRISPQILWDHLTSVFFPCFSLLTQYIDGLLLCSFSFFDSLLDTGPSICSC